MSILGTFAGLRMTSDKDANKVAVSCINAASVCSVSTLVDEETAVFKTDREGNVELSCIVIPGDPGAETVHVLLSAADSG